MQAGRYVPTKWQICTNEMPYMKERNAIYEMPNEKMEHLELLEAVLTM